MAGIDLICVDPGSNTVGLALFAGGHLVEVHLIETPKQNLHRRALQQVRSGRQYGNHCEYAPTIVIEMPRIYPHSEVRPNDIVELAFVAGCVVGGLSAANSISDLVLYTAQDWGGQVCKKVKNKRTLKKHPELNDMLKIYPVSFHEHIIDAVAMGDYYLAEQNYE